jgi:hypothetical protein
MILRFNLSVSEGTIPFAYKDYSHFKRSKFIARPNVFDF